MNENATLKDIFISTPKEKKNPIVVKIRKRNNNSQKKKTFNKKQKIQMSQTFSKRATN